MKDVTQALKSLTAGNKDAVKELFPLVYKEFRIMAASFMRRERSDHTLVPTALVHEAYLRMIDQSRVQWVDRQHFFAIASLAMRRLLIDHARAHRRQTPKEPPLPLELAIDVGSPVRHLEDLIDIDDALNRLESLDPRQAKIVEYRIFAGMTVPEVAELLSVSTRTVENEWTMIKAWLKRELKKDDTCP